MRLVLTAAMFALLLSQAQAQMVASLDAPGDEVLLRVSATGVQIYDCRSAAGGSPAWVFRAPRAELFIDARPMGRHFAGPTWEHTDGSRITGKVAVSVPAPRAGDIPWLRLVAASQAGDGALSRVTVVQRINTQGGALVGACTEPGAVSEVPYTADYIMMRGAP